MQAAVVGVPGTGKSFFMVSYLSKHFSYDAFFREYTIKSDVLILTNIAGLKFYGSSCWNVESPELLGDASNGIDGKITREEFFTIDYMQGIMDKTGKKNIVLALDEIQRDQYFPLGYKNSKVLYMFQYHRHIGMDIILGTQDAALMSRGVLGQCEYLAHGTLRSKKLLATMSYRFTDNKGNFLYSKGLRPSKEIFAAYQSATNDECAKPKNAIKHWIVITGCFLLLAGGLFKTSLAVVASKAKPENARKQISPSAAALQSAAMSGAKSAVAPGVVSPPGSPPPPPVPPVPYANYSSMRTNTIVAMNNDTINNLPRVIGYVKMAGGGSERYLLSNGQTFSSTRKLSIGDIYVR